MSDPGYARKLAESSIYEAAQAKDNPERVRRERIRPTAAPPVGGPLVALQGANDVAFVSPFNPAFRITLDLVRSRVIPPGVGSGPGCWPPEVMLSPRRPPHPPAPMGEYRYNGYYYQIRDSARYPRPQRNSCRWPSALR